MPVVLLAVIFACHVNAQPIRDLLPGPITSDEFDRWLRPLDPSHDARIAAEAAHERYKSAYRRFRDVEVSRAAAQIEAAQHDPEAQRTGAFNELKDSLGARLRSRLQEIDRQLINDLRLTLGEPMSEAVDQFAQVRQRAHHRVRFTRPGSGASYPNLAEVVRGLDMQPEEFDAVAPLLASYELDILAPEARFIEAFSTWTETRRAMAAEHQYIDPDHPEHILIPSWVIEEADRLTFGPVPDAEIAIRESTIDWARRLEQALPDRIRRQFRKGWLSSQYPSAFESRDALVGQNAEYELRLAVENDVISGEGRAAAESLVESFHSEMSALFEEFIPIFDAYERLRIASPRRYETPDSPEIVESINRFQERERALRLRFSKELRSILRDHAVSVPTSGRAAPPLPLLVAMSARELNTHTRWLGLDDGARELADHFHQEYVDAWTATLRREWEPLLTVDGAGADSPVAGARARMAQAERLRDARISLARTLAELDAELIRTLSALATDHDELAMRIDWLTRDRVRRRLNPDWIRPRRDEKRFVDPIEILLDDTRIPPRAELVVGLRAFQDELLPLLERRRRMLIERDAVAARDLLDVERAREHGERPPRGAETRLHVWSKTLLELEDRLVETTLRHLAGIVRELPSDDAAHLEAAFRVAAYPTIFPDRDDAVVLATAALELVGLSGDQRAALAAALHQHANEYAAVNERMIGVIVGSESALTMFERAGRARSLLPFHERRLQVEYDRRELNATTLRAIRALLTAEQAARWDDMPPSRR